ncbi:hypothetical protein D3C77_248250 [compost metagenome]
MVGMKAGQLGGRRRFQQLVRVQAVVVQPPGDGADRQQPQLARLLVQSFGADHAAGPQSLHSIAQGIQALFIASCRFHDGCADSQRFLTAERALACICTALTGNAHTHLLQFAIEGGQGHAQLLRRALAQRRALAVDCGLQLAVQIDEALGNHGAHGLGSLRLAEKRVGIGSQPLRCAVHVLG